MGLKKHGKQLPEIYLREGGRKCVKGHHNGPKTVEDRKALLLPQAEAIINKFGGARELARVLKAMSDDPRHHYNPSSIYRWTYPVEVGGTGGEIPSDALKIVKRAARFAGIMLTSQDLYPQLFPAIE